MSEIPVTDSLCEVPVIIQGKWFSRENGVNTITKFDERTMERKGECIEILNTNNDNYTFVFGDATCRYCVRLFVRTVNIMEKVETPCINLKSFTSEAMTIRNMCGKLDTEQNLITMFSENPTPKNCRSSVEGVFRFGYQRRDMFTGECIHHDANITACQTPGTQYLIENQQFVINYRKCEGMDNTFDADVYYSCLGEWFLGKNQYFAAMNTKESRKEEKYRCFLKNRDDDYYLGGTITAECGFLKTPQESPERFRLIPVKAEIVNPGCKLPKNFTGLWINTANLDADVEINTTHIIETWHPDEIRYRRHVYVCQEQRDTRYLMARLGVDGCQKDYMCFEFVPRHHNIIRFRKGTVMWKSDFHTVCSWVQFPNRIAWKYDILVARNPVPVKCPLAGKFRFDQKGDLPFETRIRGGVTQSPRPNVYCKENISDFSVCDKDQKVIAVDATYCLSVDYLGRPVDIYSEPDYIMKCIGYWKENLLSYMITMDEEDAFSRFRCWVYQRADLNRVLMSYAVGAFCNLNQKVTSWNATEGAVISLSLTEYERERDDCPMYFDDGGNPWSEVDESVTVLFGAASRLNCDIIVVALLAVVTIRIVHM